MITIAVCDDNSKFAERIVCDLRALCAKDLPEDTEVDVFDPFGSCFELLSFMEKQPVSILFLDIDMPEVNGFQAAEKICKQYPDTKIIFVSSYDDFVYTSFDYNPFRYLRKSRIGIELPDTFRKVIEKCTDETESVVFNTVDGEKAIMFSEIRYVVSEGNYYFVRTKSGVSYKCRGTLNDAEKVLSRSDFFRIHQSYIVNMNEIASVRKNEVEMKKNEVLTVSRRKIQEFRSAYLTFSRKRF